jgi:tetratricopeptide (TPR) repeat protein
MKPPAWIWGLFFLVLAAQASQAQTAQMVITADMQFGYADSLFHSQDYPAAQVEFKRFLHFFPEDSRRFEAEFKTAMALYHQGNFHDAATQFNQIILKEGADPMTVESYFMQARAFLKMGNPGYAQIVLQNFLKLNDTPEIRDRIYLELAQIQIQNSNHIGSKDLDQAQKYLSMIPPDKGEPFGVKKQLAAIERAKNAPQKKPGLAGIFAVIPGAGFLYCGRYKDAFVTFCLNAGLIFAAYQAFDNDNPALGGVIAFVETGFYGGNIYGSISAAHKYNRAQQINILNQAFNVGSRIDLKNNSYFFSLNHPF